MSSGIAVSLPLVTDDVYGPYRLNTTFEQIAKQNLRMLVLTAPGERMFDPIFGVGLRNYMFEMNGPDTYGKITTAIKQQALRYLPYITIDQIRFATPEDNPDLFPHNLQVSIFFTIVPIRASVALQIQVNQPI
jgi:phage baseplate assembly protein W